MNNQFSKLAVVYTRVSTEEQAKHDLSLPFQKDKCGEYAKKEGYIVAETFEESGKSGRTAKRPGLISMLDYCSEHKVEAVIVHKSDRLARNMADFWTISNLLKSKGIRLHSVTENFDDSPSGTLTMGVMSAVAQHYSENLSQEVKKGQYQKIAKGIWPNEAPHGYENYGLKHDRRIRPLEDYKQYIIQSFELFATDSYSIDSLTEKMAEMGMISVRGNKVTRSILARILRNPIYYGGLPWKGKVYPGEHEPIIDKELFDSVQRILDTRKKKGTRDRKHNFLLRGIVYCKCGTMLTGDQKVKKYKNGKEQTFYYFGCKNTKKDKKCSRNYISMSALEDSVAEIFKEIEFSEEFRKTVIRIAREIIKEVRSHESKEEKIINQRITRTKQRMKNLEDDRLDRIISSNDFAAMHARLKDELEEALESYNKLSQNHSKSVKILDQLIKLSENIYDMYVNAPSNALRREYLHIFLDKVYVDNRKVIKVAFTPVIEKLVEIEQVRIRNEWRGVWDKARIFFINHVSYVIEIPMLSFK